MKFFDHFRQNLVEYPVSIWRKMWRWTPMYWLRCHTFTKYHIVDCRNSYYDRTPYKWGWIDRDEVLLLANFNILVEFIELEKPDVIIDWEASPDHSFAWQEMNSLYKWWKTERRADWTALDKLPITPWQPHMEMEATLRKKDEEQLIRLIKIRLHLWT